mmetsp:Transcript_21171/g.63198  ORF Transcript_21171/g.63198 Transcript_21171/m.63198 type:complete len:431 (-) Transcript_21171:31-1323(-)
MMQFAALCFLCAALARGQNLASTPSGLTIAALGEMGLKIAMPFDTVIANEFSFRSFDDVSVDAANDQLFFALSTGTRTVCSFKLRDTERDIVKFGFDLASCVSGDFSVTPFCGVAARGGTLVISGGTGGFTVYTYEETGLIADEPVLLNQRFPNVVGFPDVILINENLAALSTDFRDESFRFGTQMVALDLEGPSVELGKEFRVGFSEADQLGFDLSLGPANFALQNAAFDGDPWYAPGYMYTAHGVVQANELWSGTFDVSDAEGIPAGFRAVTVAVNAAKRVAVCGGVLAGASSVLFFNLTDGDPATPARGAEPTWLDPAFVRAVPVEGRVTSVATGGDVAAYILEGGDTIRFLDIETGDAVPAPGTVVPEPEEDDGPVEDAPSDPAPEEPGPVPEPATTPAPAPASDGATATSAGVAASLLAAWMLLS